MLPEPKLETDEKFYAVGLEKPRERILVYASNSDEAVVRATEETDIAEVNTSQVRVATSQDIVRAYNEQDIKYMNAVGNWRLADRDSTGSQGYYYILKLENRPEYGHFIIADKKETVDDSLFEGMADDPDYNLKRNQIGEIRRAKAGEIHALMTGKIKEAKIQDLLRTEFSA